MPCVWLKNGVKLNLSWKAHGDPEFMKSLDIGEPPEPRPLTPEQQERYEELCERFYKKHPQYHNRKPYPLIPPYRRSKKD